MAEQNEVKVGEVYLLSVRVTSRNVNMEREYLAVEPVGMEVPELVAEYVTLLRSLRKLGFTKEAKQALGKCAFYFGALMMQKAD